jgi:phenylalanyl-tRNA synthetase beta chain
MKVSLNWVKQYTDVDLPIDELVQKIGQQLGAVEEVVDLGKKYRGIVIAKVVSCEKHPNADKLKVCLIDDGGQTKDVERNKDGLVQVVCGAPNVQAGQLVAWLPPGRTVPSTYDKDPFVLEARELRGVVSNGMLASAQELGIGDDHSGILVLNLTDQTIGQDFAKVLELDDYIIDIENKMFTHRPDCFGLLGVAREVAAITRSSFPTEGLTYFGDRTTGEHDSDKELLSVANDIPELVPRFTGRVVQDVKVGPSSIFIQARLSKVGIRPVNNIVDVTNYLMYYTGQPLHAYDYDKVKSLSEDGAKLVIRHPKKGEKLTLLGGKEIEPRAEAIVIATDKKPIGLGGVMGGADTEVDENTKNIILECANFDMYNIRRTSMAHGLFTEAVTRFNKGQSPLQCHFVLSEAAVMVEDEAGGKAARSIYDIKGKLAEPPEVSVSVNFINERLGLSLDADEIVGLLKRVGFECRADDQTLEFKAPLWRTDIHIPEDIVEEVGRLYDYGRVPKALPKRDISPTELDKNLQFKSELRSNLASLGANEVLTYGFVHGNLLEKTGQNKDMAFKITNALSPDLQYYRLSLTPSLLAHIHSNIKSGHDRFAIFEIGKAHNKMHKDDDNGVPKEYEIAALAYADKNAKPGEAYYVARNYLDEMAARLGVEIDYRPIDKEADVPVVKPFDPERSALVFAGGTTLGIIGEFKAGVRKQLKLPVGSAGFEIGLQELMKARSVRSSYRPISRFPSISQDICLEVDEAVRYGELTKQLKGSFDRQIGDHQSYNLQPIDIYESEKIKGRKRITCRVTLTDYERTLTESVLTKVLDQVSSQLEKSIQAKRI